MSTTTQDTPAPDVQIVKRYADDDDQATMYAVIVNGDELDEFITREEADAEAAAVKAAHERTELVTAVHALADFIAVHPELPLPRVLTYLPSTGVSGDSLLTVAARLRELGYAYTVREKPYSTNGSIELQVPLGADVSYDIDARREDICTPRVENGKVIWDLPAELQQPDEPGIAAA